LCSPSGKADDQILDFTRAVERQPRFQLGDAIVTRNIHPLTHTRLPRFARGKPGVIIALRGAHVFPDTSAVFQGENAQPLYTVESFRNAATVRQMIAQLQARLTVADKYTDWAPVFAKMTEYVGSVDASDDEKRKFLAVYESTLPRTLAASKAITDKEHTWLLASLDLYQFALAKDGAYVWQNGNLTFKQRADSDRFRQKFTRARALNADFLRAYWEVRNAQEALLAELGMQDSEFDHSSGP